jgi:hypothetical protein
VISGKDTCGFPAQPEPQVFILELNRWQKLNPEKEDNLSFLLEARDEPHHYVSGAGL